MNRLLTVFVYLVASVNAYAWDGIASGEIYGFEVTQDVRWAIKVSLVDGTKPLCGNNNNWGYVNKGDENYQTFISTLLASEMAGRTVTLYSTQDSSGYCHIGHMSIK